MRAADVTVSVVSHGHGAAVPLLLGDLAGHCGAGIRVVLTVNVPEPLDVDERAQPFALRIVRNAAPRGFAANHNAALRDATTPFLCVLNPDIRIPADPFPPLLDELRKPSVGVAGPRILNPAGGVEDSARRFPTPLSLLGRRLGLAPALDYAVADAPLSADWLAGMFLVIRKEVFAEIGGFDERYFLYCEDVDLCRRLRRRGYDVRLVPAAGAVHDARRRSRRDARHLRWHLASLLRYFLLR